MADEKALIERIEKLEKEVENLNKILTAYDRALLLEAIDKLKSFNGFEEFTNELAQIKEIVRRLGISFRVIGEDEEF